MSISILFIKFVIYFSILLSVCAVYSITMRWIAAIRKKQIL